VCDLRVIEMNPACVRLWGLPEGTTDANILDIAGEDQDPKALLDAVAQVLATHQPRTEVVHRPVGGIDVEIMLFPGEGDKISCILNDVTEQVRMSEALAAEQERLTVTLDSIGDGVIATDNDGRVTVLNGVAAQITGMSAAQALGMPVEHVLRQGAAAAALREGEAQRRNDYTVTSLSDGTQRIVSENTAPIRSGDGRLLGVVMALHDVTERRIREERILYLSYHDMLTGLYNRTFFEEELRRLDTARQLPLAVIMGDVNNLKLVNDVFGHVMGDELLKNIAQILRESCRTEDIISRWGGDEFTILLPRTDQEGALAICDRILRRCSVFQDGAEGYLSPSISLGCAVKATAEMDIDTAIQIAENAMYSRKLTDSRDVYETFVNSLLRALRKDGGLADEHIERLTWMCVSLGREMGLEEHALDNLRVATMLQDIGTVVVDRNIIQKPGPLTEDEWEQIHRHPGIGYRIARASAQHVAISAIILNHHERWDGTGYPSGLKGDQIPLEARILAVVDAYDAMTQHRPYRQALSPEEAVREIVAQSGAQFDPAVVNAFVCVIGTADDPLGGIAAVSM
jgi:diguanylate cyclase (GGDEF)-like protein/PAS domain S-box-containing protein